MNKLQNTKYITVNKGAFMNKLQNTTKYITVNKGAFMNKLRNT